MKVLSAKLAAILSADVEGYSRLMGDDEEATVRTLTAYREVLYHTYPTAQRQSTGLSRVIIYWLSLLVLSMLCSVL